MLCNDMQYKFSGEKAGSDSAVPPVPSGVQKEGGCPWTQVCGLSRTGPRACSTCGLRPRGQEEGPASSRPDGSRHGCSQGPPVSRSDSDGNRPLCSDPRMPSRVTLVYVIPETEKHCMLGQKRLAYCQL